MTRREPRPVYIGRPKYDKSVCLPCDKKGNLRANPLALEIARLAYCVSELNRRVKKLEDAGKNCENCEYNFPDCPRFPKDKVCPDHVTEGR